MGLRQGTIMTKQAPTIISSDDTIQNFDSHIKVSAGPGAGKTTWLARHIVHVARKSKRLHKAARIVCISYTNAASEAIRSKLGECADIVETSTIHSFLFSNVVRPYLHILKDENGQCLVVLPSAKGCCPRCPARVHRGHSAPSCGQGASRTCGGLRLR